MRIWIAAGEASGDQLGAELVGLLEPEACRGLVGPALREAGAGVAARTEEATAIGLFEVVGRLAYFRRLLDQLEADAVDFGPDVVVTIDAPELCLRLGRRLKARGIPVVHWVSPQVWAWRRGRVATMRQSCDRLLCLLPFEPALYEGHGVDAVFTGHPAYARARALPRVASTAQVLGIFPGSRPGEVRRLAPSFAAAAHLLRRQRPQLQIRVSRAPTIKDLGPLEDFRVEEGFGAVAGRCDAALVASGTATLELAAMGVPMVAAYRLHPLTWLLARWLVKLEHVTLPNLILGRGVVPEHLQRLRPDALAKDVGMALAAPETQRRAFDELGQRLGGGDAVARAAEAVRSLLR